MPGQGRRSRSTTATSQRPPSRASTTSIHTAPLLPTDHGIPQYTHSEFPSQNPAAQQLMIDQFGPEAEILALQNSFDPQLHGLTMDGNVHMEAQMQNHGQNGYYQDQSAQYHAQALEYGMQAPRPMSASGTSNGKGKKKAPGASNAANEKHEQELHDLLARNQGRSLGDVGKEVLKNERTSKCEKSKQLFAMLWLGDACIPAKTSVPRGRVYATYAARCGDERVQPLNPASFGKLVRVIFPGITTRRLGVRGESKYHYVDLALKNDPEEHKLGRGMGDINDAPIRPPSTRPSSIDLGSLPMPRLAPDTAALPTDDETFNSPALEARPLPQQADGRIYADTITPGFHFQGPYAPNSYRQHLSFQPTDQAHDTIMLPDINLYLTAHHDQDSANALSALYRSHCTSLVDCIRFCKEKQFFRLFTSFAGTLTVPVQKLFTNPAMAPWIKECDWLMYQNMVQCISGLILDVLPMPVTKLLDTIAKNLQSHIIRTFQSHPEHVLEAKLEPATLFCELVARLLKVNSTAHAAAVVLNTTEVRESMWQCWVDNINPKRLMESELPWCGHEETYNILTREILPLLEPVAFKNLSGTHYQNVTMDPNASNAPESIIDRIGNFVRSIPSRFPHASPRTVVDCVKNVGTAAMRDMTINHANSFHAWWCVKIFVDEMVQWLASSGGFLAHKPVIPESPVVHSASAFANGVHTSSGQFNSLNGFATDGFVAYQSGAPHPNPAHQHHMMNQAHQMPPTFKQHQPRPQNSRKRSATDSNLATESQSPAKRVRSEQLSQTSQPQFDHRISFGSSFDSAPATRPPSAHQVPDEMDDSGIGLGLFDSPFGSKHHTNPLHLHDMTNEALAATLTKELQS